MGQGFPVEWGQRVTAAIVTAHVLLLGTTLTAIVGYLATRRRQPKTIHAFWWATAILLGPAFGLIQSNDEIVRDSVRPTIFIYIGIIWILPSMNQMSLYQKYDQSKSWDEVPNSTLAQICPREFHCPSKPHAASEHRFTDFVMLSGLWTFGDDARRRQADGTSQKIAVVEAAGLRVGWSEPRDFDTEKQPIGINLKGQGTNDSPGMLSSYHRLGPHVLLADGSVKQIHPSIDPQLLRQLTTISAETNGTNGDTVISVVRLHSWREIV